MKIAKIYYLDSWKDMEQHIVGKELEMFKDDWFRFKNEQDAKQLDNAISDSYSNKAGMYIINYELEDDEDTDQ